MYGNSGWLRKRDFRGNPRNPRKIRPIHARWAAPRNGSRESALLNSKALGVRPRGKKQLEISGTFLNFWQAGFDFRGFPGFRGKSSENVPSSENLSRAPVTNRRCGRLRMTVVDHQPDGRGPPACAVWWGGAHWISEDFLGILGILGKSRFPKLRIWAKKNIFPKCSPGLWYGHQI